MAGISNYQQKASGFSISGRCLEYVLSQSWLEPRRATPATNWENELPVWGRHHTWTHFPAKPNLKPFKQGLFHCSSYLHMGTGLSITNITNWVNSLFVEGGHTWSHSPVALTWSWSRRATLIILCTHSWNTRALYWASRQFPYLR